MWRLDVPVCCCKGKCDQQHDQKHACTGCVLLAQLNTCTVEYRFSAPLHFVDTHLLALETTYDKWVHLASILSIRVSICPTHKSVS